jgi:phosphoglycerate-specific signal transduction histidine kinase
VLQAVTRIVKDRHRAGEVIGRIRALVKKSPPLKDHLNINEAIREVIELTLGEMVKNDVSVRTDLADGLPLIHGDRVRLQQVLLNLIINAVEAMSSVSNGARKLLVRTAKAEAGDVLVAVRDSGPGLDPKRVDRLFETFYTTKLGGMGMGLAICRSIIEAHGGRLWASTHQARAAVFQFTLQNGMRSFHPSTSAKFRRCERTERRLLSRSLASAAPTQMIQIFHRPRHFATAGYWKLRLHWPKRRKRGAFSHKPKRIYRRCFR